MRLLWTYLFERFCASSNIALAFMWHQLIAHRGANDVVSSLSHFIYNTRSVWSRWCQVEYLVGRQLCWANVIFRIWSGRVSTLEFTIYSSLLGIHMVQQIDALELSRTIWVELSYIVYSPQGWFRHVKDSAVTESWRVEVIEMQREYFRQHQKHLHQLYTECNTETAILCWWSTHSYRTCTYQ